MTLPVSVDALGLAEALRDGEVRPEELVEGLLEAIDRDNSALNAICHLAPDEARAQAEGASRRLADGDPAPFLGVPMLIKELDAVAGWPLCGATRAVVGGTPAADAAVVGLLRRAGFVLVGTTTSPELGTLAVTESSLHGATRNPWDTSRSAGGSSGGAAAAVAAGWLPAAHGSDGGGSLREPASFCGLVGLKPSRGRVPGGEGLSTDGVLTTTVRDSAALLDVLSGPPRAPWYPPPRQPEPYLAASVRRTPRLRVGLSLRTSFRSEVSHEAAAAVESVGTALVELGHHVSQVPGIDLDEQAFTDAFLTVYTTATAGLPVTSEELLDPSNREMRRRARQVNALQYAAAVEGLQAWVARTVAHWGADYDVLVTPTNPAPAPLVGEVLKDQDNDPWSPIVRSSAIATFTAPYNALGLPAVSLPLHVTAEGLPLGVQLVGPPWRDDLVLAVAAELEREVGFQLPLRALTRCEP